MTVVVVSVALAVLGAFLLLCRIAVKRHARDPLVMPFRTGSVGWLGEAPASVHHRLGARKP